MSRVIAIIQARLGSTRFPNKVLADIGGKPMIAHVVERVKAVRLTSVLVAVPRRERYRFPCHVQAIDANESDVLGRVWMAAREAEADTVIRITGDCPLLAPDICQEVINASTWDDAPYVWNCGQGYVDGTDCEAIRMDVLEHAHVAATSDYDREHVTSWIRRHYPVLTVPPRGDYSQHKWSVDDPSDMERVQAIAARLKPGAFMFADTLAAEAEAGL